MFGVRYWHEEDRQSLDDAVWDAMKRAIDQRNATSNRSRGG